MGQLQVDIAPSLFLWSLRHHSCKARNHHWF